MKSVKHLVSGIGLHPSATPSIWCGQSGFDLLRDREAFHCAVFHRRELGAEDCEKCQAEFDKAIAVTIK